MAPPSGGREDFSQMGPTEMGFWKIKRRVVGRKTYHLDSAME